MTENIISERKTGTQPPNITPPPTYTFPYFGITSMKYDMEVKKMGIKY